MDGCGTASTTPRKLVGMTQSPRDPEKPTLDGLEDTVGGRLGGAGHLPLRPHRDRASRSSRSTPRRRRSAGRCTSATSSATPTPTPSPASSACAASRSSTRWGGTTTACRPSAACRTTTACAAIRRCPTTPTSPRRRSRARSRSRSRGRNFVELCERLTAEDEKAFEAALAPARPVGRLVADLRDHRRRAARDLSQRAFLRNLARGEAYPSEAPTLWDVTFRTAVAQAELEDRERPGAYHRIGFAGPRRRAGRSSRPPGPSCCRRAWRSSRTPTTSATSRCSARPSPRRCSASRCRSSRTTSPIPTRGPASR